MLALKLTNFFLKSFFFFLTDTFPYDRHEIPILLLINNKEFIPMKISYTDLALLAAIGMNFMAEAQDINLENGNIFVSGGGVTLLGFCRHND